jgi:hypothetical protein
MHISIEDVIEKWELICFWYGIHRKFSFLYETTTIYFCIVIKMSNYRKFCITDYNQLFSTCVAIKWLSAAFRLQIFHWWMPVHSIYDLQWSNRVVYAFIRHDYIYICFSTQQCMQRVVNFKCNAISNKSSYVWPRSCFAMCVNHRVLLLYLHVVTALLYEMYGLPGLWRLWSTAYSDRTVCVNSLSTCLCGCDCSIHVVL